MINLNQQVIVTLLQKFDKKHYAGYWPIHTIELKPHDLDKIKYLNNHFYQRIKMTVSLFSNPVRMYDHISKVEKYIEYITKSLNRNAELIENYLDCKSVFNNRDSLFTVNDTADKVSYTHALSIFRQTLKCYVECLAYIDEEVIQPLQQLYTQNFKLLTLADKKLIHQLLIAVNKEKCDADIFTSIIHLLSHSHNK